MTPNEFKAWFDGFTEALTGTPTKEQWKRIKARVAEIDGKTVTYPVYVDRYLPSYPTWPYRSNSLGGICGSVTTYTASALPQNSADASYSNTFNSITAMGALGRAEAISMGAV